MILTELRDFYTRWVQKAEEYRNQNLQDCFDRFFTLYVAYNRLYAELAIHYIKRGLAGGTVSYISDGQAAKLYVRRYLGADNISRIMDNDISCKEAISSIINLLERKVFSIKLNRLSGQRRLERKVFATKLNRLPREREVEADSILLEGLKSNRAFEKIYAVLDVIYSVRCNMFHGQKGYDNEQIQLLVPVTILLKKIMTLLYEKMSHDDNINTIQSLL